MTFKEYLDSWHIGVFSPNNKDPIWAAVPKDTIDPIGKRLTAGTKETLMWLLEMNYKDQFE